MAFKGNFLVKAGPTLSNATSVFTLGSFDTASLAETGAGLDSVGLIRVRSCIYMAFSGGDHSSRLWERTSLVSLVGGAGLAFKGSANGNSGSAGIVGDANSSTIVFDLSGTSWRCRVTPATTDGMLWYAVHAVESVEMQ